MFHWNLELDSSLYSLKSPYKRIVNITLTIENSLKTVALEITTWIDNSVVIYCKLCHYLALTEDPIIPWPSEQGHNLNPAWFAKHKKANGNLESKSSNWVQMEKFHTLTKVKKKNKSIKILFGKVLCIPTDNAHQKYKVFHDRLCPCFRKNSSDEHKPNRMIGLLISNVLRIESY